MELAIMRRHPEVAEHIEIKADQRHPNMMEVPTDDMVQSDSAVQEKQTLPQPYRATYSGGTATVLFESPMYSVQWQFIGAPYEPTLQVKSATDKQWSPTTSAKLAKLLGFDAGTYFHSAAIEMLAQQYPEFIESLDEQYNVEPTSFDGQTVLQAGKQP
jgi:hypothetical protein